MELVNVNEERYSDRISEIRHLICQIEVVWTERMFEEESA